MFKETLSANSHIKLSKIDTEIISKYLQFTAQLVFHCYDFLKEDHPSLPLSLLLFSMKFLKTYYKRKIAFREN